MRSPLKWIRSHLPRDSTLSMIRPDSGESRLYGRVLPGRFQNRLRLGLRLRVSARGRRDRWYLLQAFGRTSRLVRQCDGRHPADIESHGAGQRSQRPAGTSRSRCSATGVPFTVVIIMPRARVSFFAFLRARARRRTLPERSQLRALRLLLRKKDLHIWIAAPEICDQAPSQRMTRAPTLRVSEELRVAARGPAQQSAIGVGRVGRGKL